MSFPLLGCGLGLRTPHYAQILAEKPAVDWFEAISENYMDTGGRPIQILEKIRRNYLIGLHGVALSIGSVDPVHLPYLEKLKTLVERIDPAIVSDHICWSGVGGEHLHDLLPLPFTEESLRVIVEKTNQVQDFLKRRILLENASTYVTFKHSEMSEWEFVREVAKRSGCGLLLDINNVYVNAKNHGFDAREYIQNIPGELVGQIHLAGHTDKGKYLFDTHSTPVIEEVWNLYKEALLLWGQKTTLMEWDEEIPELSVLVEECEKARKIYHRVTSCQLPLTRNEKFKNHNTLVTGSRLLVTPKLKDLQLWMRSKIEPSIRDGSPHLLSPQELTREPSLILNPQSGDPGIDRLEIYAGGYLARTEESLKEVYPAVRHILGEDSFHQLSHLYADQYSSPHYNLNVKGEKLPEFIQTTPWSKDLPFLSDLALLEWKIAEAFHSFDLAVFDVSKMNSFSPDDWSFLKFAFQPSVYLLDSEWPILDLWESIKLPRTQIKIEMDQRPQKILVGRRPNREVFCKLLDEAEYALLRSLKDGRCLGDSLEDLTAFESDLKLTDWFSCWIKDGLISEVIKSESMI